MREERRSIPANIIQKAVSDLYVDNLIIRTSSCKGVNVYYLIKTIFKRASMNLRECFFKKQELEEAVQKRDQEKDEVLELLGIFYGAKKQMV